MPNKLSGPQWWIFTDVRLAWMYAPKGSCLRHRGWGRSVCEAAISIPGQWLTKGGGFFYGTKKWSTKKCQELTLSKPCWLPPLVLLCLEVRSCIWFGTKMYFPDGNNVSDSTPVWDGLGPNSSIWHYFHRKMQEKFQTQVYVCTPIEHWRLLRSVSAREQGAFCISLR